jgi:hypothetical protein
MHSDTGSQAEHHGTRFVLRLVPRGQIVNRPIPFEFVIGEHIFVSAIEQVNVFVALDLEQPGTFLVDVVVSDSIGRSNKQNGFEPFNVLNDFFARKSNDVADAGLKDLSIAGFPLDVFQDNPGMSVFDLFYQLSGVISCRVTQVQFAICVNRSLIEMKVALGAVWIGPRCHALRELDKRRKLKKGTACQRVMDFVRQFIEIPCEKFAIAIDKAL